MLEPKKKKYLKLSKYNRTQNQVIQNRSIEYVHSYTQREKYIERNRRQEIYEYTKKHIICNICVTRVQKGEDRMGRQ